MVTLHFVRLKNNLSAFTLIETMISIGLLVLLIFPFYLLTNQTFHTINAARLKSENSLNIKFVLNSIQEELNNITFVESDFQPKNLMDSNLLLFRHTDGKIIRYYKVGEELVKDFNYVGYNAITPKIIRLFQVRRTDYPGYMCISITIQDREGYVYQRKITKKIPF